MNNYLTEEIQNLNIIIQKYFKELVLQCQKAIKNKFLNSVKNKNYFESIKLWELIKKHRISISVVDLNELRNEENYKLIDAIFYILFVKI